MEQNLQNLQPDVKKRTWKFYAGIGGALLFIAYVVYCLTVDHYDNIQMSTTKTITHPQYGKIQCFANKDLICGHILSGKVWEEELFESGFKPFIEPDTVVLDCGSYVGCHTILIKNLDRNNLVIAFEMMPEHYRVLRTNIELNKLSDTLSFNVALGNQNTDIALPEVDYKSKSEQNYGATQLSQSPSSVHIPMVTLDYITPWMKNKRVSFMKIDVEGHEIPVLEGGLQLIYKNRPYIAIEIWNEQMETFSTSKIWRLLSQEMGYRRVMISDIHDYLLYPKEKEDYVKQQLKLDEEIVLVYRTHNPTDATIQRLKAHIKDLAQYNVKVWISIDRTFERYRSSQDKLIRAFEGNKQVRIHKFTEEQMKQRYPELGKIVENDEKNKEIWARAAINKSLTWMFHWEAIALLNDDLRFKYQDWKYIWVIEDDVGYTGNIAQFLIEQFKHSDADLIGKSFPRSPPDAENTWLWKNFSSPEYVKFMDGQQQIANGEHCQRFSRRLFDTWCEKMSQGIHAVSEMGTPMMVEKMGYKTQDLAKEDMGLYSYDIAIDEKQWKEIESDPKQARKLFHALKF